MYSNKDNHNLKWQILQPASEFAPFQVNYFKEPTAKFILKLVSKMFSFPKWPADLFWLSKAAIQFLTWELNGTKSTSGSLCENTILFPSWDSRYAFDQYSELKVGDYSKFFFLLPTFQGCFPFHLKSAVSTYGCCIVLLVGYLSSLGHTLQISSPLLLNTAYMKWTTGCNNLLQIADILHRLRMLCVSLCSIY